MARTPKPRGYPLTIEILAEYRDAALANARSLCAEAKLLLDANHHARAYFLAVAAIEETGKAVQASDGIGRNLSDPAVRTKLQTQFADHSTKITSAFIPSVIVSKNLRSVLASLIEVAVHVTNGREPSMYTDLVDDGARVTSPANLVRPISSNSCVELAHDLLAQTTTYVLTRTPTSTTWLQDRFFALNQKTFLKLANTADFWQYYISRAEAGSLAIEEAATEYHDNYFSKGKTYRPNGESGA